MHELVSRALRAALNDPLRRYRIMDVYLERKHREEQEAMRLHVEERQILLLATRWLTQEVGMSSSYAVMTDCPSFRAIVAMGSGAVPSILRILQQRPSLLVWALGEITGENPVARRHAGNIDKMAKAWLKWGKRKGLA